MVRHACHGLGRRPSEGRATLPASRRVARSLEETGATPSISTCTSLCEPLPQGMFRKQRLHTHLPLESISQERHRSSPDVSVPVLSRAMCVASASTSKTSPPLTSTPLRDSAAMVAT